MRVVQRCQQPRFAVETGAPIRIGREQAREDLDRHVAGERRIVRSIDLAHATDTQHAENAIGTELVAHQGWITPLNGHSPHKLQRRPFEKLTSTARVRKQRLDLLP